MTEIENLICRFFTIIAHHFQSVWGDTSSIHFGVSYDGKRNLNFEPLFSEEDRVIVPPNT